MTLELVLSGHDADLGDGFQVRRMLPSARRQAVGPFVFFDHFGPVAQQAGQAFDVRPHPHIGLATVTWLFEGAILHRDSLGSRQRIEPGALNWMTAGRGIVHSERTPDDQRARDRTLHGLQLWCALPLDHEESAPAFVHLAPAEIPRCKAGDAEVRVLAGAAWGVASPLLTPMETLYLELALPAGGRLELPRLAPEQAIYAVEGALQVAGESLAARTMGVLAAHCTVVNAGAQPARLVVIGGAALDAPRYLWWNFVSSRRERIRQAAEDWAAHRLPAIPGDDERIELPDRPLPAPRSP